MPHKVILAVFLTAILNSLAPAQMGGGMGPGGGHGHDPGNLPGWQGHEIEHNVVLPQVAVGDGVTMTLIFSNLGGPRRMGWFANEEDYTVTGTLRFFAADGSPLAVEINGVTGSEFPLELEASAVSYLEVSAPAGTELQRGWLLVEVEDVEQSDWGFRDGHAVVRGERVMVSAYYSIFSPTNELESQVAVRPATFSRGFFTNSLVAAQYRQTPSGPVRTGIAVVNTGSDAAIINLRLIDESGGEVEETVLELAAGAQDARFVDEIFPSIREGFRGVLELSTTAEGVVSMGLLQTGLVTTSLPSHHWGGWNQVQ
jgi:hypothetical protein